MPKCVAARGRTVAAMLGICLIVPTLCAALPDTVDPRAPGNSCNECHRLDPLFSHPVGVIPSMAVPDTLPLEDGRLTCGTCHDAVGPGHVKTRDPQLRQPAVMLCLSCHQPGASEKRVTHGAAIGRAHLPRTSGTPTAAGTLDSESRNCITCHDGSVAAEASALRSQSAWGLPQEHPVGSSYDQSVKGTKVAPATLLDQRIRLVEGKVSCVSCHSPYSTEKTLLVMSNRNSALCLSCHQR